jgi:nitrite reductase (NADH) large subunit
VTSTKLKVTGIDLFSAGDYMGGKAPRKSSSTTRTAAYKKLVIKDNKLVGGVMYGDTADGRGTSSCSRTARHPRHPRSPDLRPEPGRRRRPRRQQQGRRHARQRRGLRLQRRDQGHHRQGDQGEGPVHAGRGQEAHQGGSSCGSCAGLVEQILASTIGGAYTPAALDRSRSAAAPTIRTRRCAMPSAQHLTSKEAVFKAWNGRRRTAATSAARLNYYLISSWPHEAKDDPQSRFINERAHANIQKDGTYSVVPRMWGGLTTPPNCAPSPMPPRSTTCRPSR